jgi:hypothetical protein
MLRVQIQYTVDPQHLDAVKTGASRHLAAVPPALRMEVCARALGFNTWAAMRVSALSRRPLDLDAAVNFAAGRNLAFDPLSLHLAMADATLIRIATLSPELHWHGIHEEYFSPSREEAQALRATVPAGAFFQEANRIRRSKFEESRSQLFSSHQADQVLRALALFSALAPTKTVGARSRSSYGIKHVAERQSYDIGNGLILRPAYVSNVDAIIAALEFGFPVKHHGGKSPNVSIGISVASLRKIEAEQNARRVYG